MKDKALTPQGHETMSLAFAVQEANAAENTFKGMASVFNVMIDTWTPTRIRPGAFTKTLQENRARVKILYQHDSYNPIGLPLQMEENSDGLFVAGKISQTTVGKDCMVLMVDKVIDEMSIGFDPIKHEMVEEKMGDLVVAVRHITELRLWEFSPVTWGANSFAKITSVNSLQRLMDSLGLEEAQSTFVGAILEKMRKFPQAPPAQLIQLAVAHFAEQHTGKVLADVDKTFVESCRETLHQLTVHAEPPVQPALTDVTEALRDLDVIELMTSQSSR